MSRPITIVEQNNTVQILEDAPIVTPAAWYDDLNTIPTSSASATVTADATPHTKGAWTEIIASNAAETSALLVTVGAISQSSTNTATLIDIGIGAAGSETAIVENVAVGGASSLLNGIVFVLPYQVAAGTRIAVRSQAIIASDTADVQIDTLAMGDASAVGTPTFDVLGTSTATSAGTRLAPAYSEIVASTSQTYKAIILVESQTYTVGGAYVDIQVATGAIGAEVPIAKKRILSTAPEAIYSLVYFGSLTSKNIPAGTRLSANMAYYSSARYPDLTVIGIRA